MTGPGNAGSATAGSSHPTRAYSFGVEEPSIRIDAGIGCRGALDYTFWPKGNTGRCEPLNRAPSLSPTTYREIRADILALEQETEGLLAEILGVGEQRETTA